MVEPGRHDPTDSTVRVVRITHFCRYMYQGKFSRGGAFATIEFWELHQREGRWLIARLLTRAIT